MEERRFTIPEGIEAGDVLVITDESVSVERQPLELEEDSDDEEDEEDEEESPEEEEGEISEVGSGPVVFSKQRKKRVFRCSYCKNEGHQKRNCPEWLGTFKDKDEDGGGIERNDIHRGESEQDTEQTGNTENDNASSVDENELAPMKMMYRLQCGNEACGHKWESEKPASLVNCPVCDSEKVISHGAN